MSQRAVEKRPTNAARKEESSGFIFSILTAPIRLSFAVLARVLSTLRPYAPQLIPVAVYSLFIPLVIFLSSSAGFVVYSSLSISWQVPLYLQYGCVSF